MARNELYQLPLLYTRHWFELSFCLPILLIFHEFQKILASPQVSATSRNPQAKERRPYAVFHHSGKSVSTKYQQTKLKELSL